MRLIKKIIVAILSLILLCLPLSALSIQPVPYNIFVIGDYVTNMPNENENYVGMLDEYFKNAGLQNVSINYVDPPFGVTTDTFCLADFVSCLSSADNREMMANADWIIISAGLCDFFDGLNAAVNAIDSSIDSDYWKSGTNLFLEALYPLCGTPGDKEQIFEHALVNAAVDKTETDFDSLLNIVRGNNTDAAVLVLSQCNPNSTVRLKRHINKQLSIINEYQRERVEADANAEYIDFFDLFSNTPENYVVSSGNFPYPNSDGHTLIANTIKSDLNLNYGNMNVGVEFKDMTQKNIFSIEVHWGSMEYTYSAEEIKGTWNGALHQYEDGYPKGWSCNSGADLITVYNHSNLPVEVMLAVSERADFLNSEEINFSYVEGNYTQVAGRTNFTTQLSSAVNCGLYDNGCVVKVGLTATLSPSSQTLQNVKVCTLTMQLSGVSG